MRTVSTLLAAAALVGCATPTAGSGDSFAAPLQPAQVAPVARPGPDPAAVPVFDARAEARKFDHASDCEQYARALKARDPDRGWRLLRGCVDRGDFTEIRELLDGPWDAELKSRTDAGELLTRLIAARGGDIESDVALLHDHRVPIFTLADALAQPVVYEGRLIVLRARVSDLRKADGKVTVKLAEYVHGSYLEDGQVGAALVHTQSVHQRDDTRGGPERHDTRVHDKSMVTEQRMATTEEETGREALGKMEKVDPFLEPDKDFIILARFDGVRASSETDDDQAGKTGVVTVLHYFRPGALPLY